MIESVQIRQRGAYDFESHYDNLCAMQDSCPLPAVKAHLAQGVLDINGDRVRVTDWQPLLNTLRINKSLEFVAIRSYYQPPTDDNDKKAMIEKRKMPSVRSKEITYRLCKALKECLTNTPNLACLELQGLPLRERDLTTLMKGLVKNNTLNHVSLEYCRVGDSGLDIICKGIKNSTTINSVNFTGCSLTGRGSESLAKVIKHQAMKRHNEAWRDSLRYRRPDLDRMPGIRRITINNNPMLGDSGASLLAEALKDDLWLKALDLQGCGISSTGARALLDVLKYNTTVVVLDVRRNPLIDRDVVHSIMEQLMINCNGQDTEYKWIKAEEPLDAAKLKSAKKRRTKTLNSSFGRKTTIRISAGAARRRTKSAGAVGVSRKLQPISSEGIKVGPGMPWRTAARANRYRGFPPEHIPGKASLFEKSEGSPTGSPDQTASIIIDHEDDGEDEDTLQELEKIHLDDSALSTGVNNIKDVRIEMVQMRRQLQHEKLARAKSDKRVVELSLENKRLREDYQRLRRTGSSAGGLLEDDSVLESIEGAFKQFNSFLDLLRDAGLGQLITMAGLDHQDSPFVSASQLPRSQMFSKQTPYIHSANTGGKVPPPRPVKPVSKLNGYLGDISSSNRVSPSGVSYTDKGYNKNGFGHDSNGQYGYNPSDPTMKSNFDDSFEKAEKAKKDDLYERILQETSGALRHAEVTVEDVNKDSSHANRQEQTSKENKSETKGQDNKLQGLITADKRFFAPDRKGDGAKADKSEGGDKSGDVSAESDWNKKHGVNVFDAADISDISDTRELTPVPKPRPRIHSDEGKETKQTGSRNTGGASQGSKDVGRPASRLSDYNYSMDSFDQSYLSERGEVIRLDGDLDTYGSSPSPPAQVVDSEENDF